MRPGTLYRIIGRSTLSAIVAEVPVEAFLRRLVVVRHHRQARRRAPAVLRVRGQLDRFGRRVGAGAGDDRDAAARELDRRLDEQAVLVDVDGRRFAGRADDDDAGGAVRDVEIDQPGERGKIERAALRTSASRSRRDCRSTWGLRAKSGFYRIRPGTVPAGSARLGDGRQRDGPRRVRRRPRPAAARPRAAPPSSTRPCSNATTASRPSTTRRSSPGSSRNAGIRRPAEGLVAAGERLVEQRRRRRRARRAGAGTAAGAGSWRRRSRRSARPRAARLRSRGRARAVSTPATLGKRRERGGVAVDGEHAAAAAREEARVAPLTAGEIEHARARGHERREAHDPRRRRAGASAPRAKSCASLIATCGVSALPAPSAPTSRLRLVGEPADERDDVRALRRVRRDDRVVAARRVVALRERRDEPAVAQMLGDQRHAAERDALPGDRRLDHLVVELEAQRTRGLQSRLPVRRRARRSIRATACGPRDRRGAAARDARGRRASRAACRRAGRASGSRPASSARRRGAPNPRAPCASGR